MSKLGDIKAAIKTILGTVTGLDADTIHPRLRQYSGFSDDQVATLFESNGIVNAWEMESVGFSSAWGAPNKGAYVSEDIVLQGWYEFDDSANSTATWDDLLEDAIQALNADHQLGGTVTTHESVQKRVHGTERKMGRACHYVELVLTCRYVL